MLLGIGLGPSLIGLIALDGSGDSLFSSFSSFDEHQIDLSIDILLFISELAVLLLLFQVGLDTDLGSLRKSGKSAAYASFGGMLIPFIGGLVTIWIISLSKPSMLPQGISTSSTALFFAAILTATSIGISIRIFMDLDQLHSPAARTMIGAAVIDDIFAILLLTITIAFIDSGSSFTLESLIEIGGILGSMMIFFVILILFAKFLLPRILKSMENSNDRYLPIIVALALLFFLSWQAGEVHLAPIIGSFLAGILLQSYDEFASRIRQQIAPMAHWMVIFFFISVGLRVNLGEVLTFEVALISLMIIVVAILTKVVGSGVGVYLAESSFESSLLVGISMAARGEVVLIFASLGLELGIISTALYSSLILLVVFSAVIVPIWLKYSINEFKPTPVT
ncbi:MAG: cation:proton antiporter [Candidatus Heimdallarchaeota archaeon]|nr:cation:proton antiporter [Candidatus Heimdallarchaeota archaeon]